MSLHVQRQTSLCSGWSVWQPACLMRMQHINYAWADAGMQSSHLLPEARYWNRRCQLCLIQGPPALRGAYRVWRCCGMQSGPFIGLAFYLQSRASAASAAQAHPRLHPIHPLRPSHPRRPLGITPLLNFTTTFPSLQTFDASASFLSRHAAMAYLIMHIAWSNPLARRNTPGQSQCRYLCDCSIHQSGLLHCVCPVWRRGSDRPGR